MKRKASPVLIGAFVVAGLALVAVAIIAMAGGRLFAHKGRAVMHFGGSVYGLQEGAPVVFRGVRVGTVTSTITCRSPRTPARRRCGTPRPRSRISAPGWVPGRTSTISSPSGVGTLMRAPSAAWLMDTGRS